MRDRSRAKLSCLVASLLMCLSPGLAAQQVAPLQKPDYAKSNKKLKGAVLVPQLGHSRALTSLSVSADGAVVASASGMEDGVVKVWDGTTGRLLHTLDSEDYVAVSPDGKLVAAGNAGGPVRVWATSTGERVAELAASGPVLFSPDGQTLLTERMGKDGPDGAVQLWSVQGFKAGVALEGHQASLLALSLTTDGKYLATASFDETIKIWNLGQGQLARTITREGRSLGALALAPSAEEFALSYREGEPVVEVWSAGNGKIKRKLEGHTRAVVGLAYSADGATLATGSLDGTTRLWKSADGTLQDTVRGGGGQVALAANAPLLAHGVRQIVIADATTGAPTATLGVAPKRVFQAVFSDNGARIIATDGARRVDLWDSVSSKLLSSFAIPNGKGETFVGEVVLGPTGKYAALRPFEGDTVRLWRVETGEPAGELRAEGATSISGITFSPDEAEVVLEASLDNGEKTALQWRSVEGGALLASTQIAGMVRVQSFVDEGANAGLVSHGTPQGKARLSVLIWERESGLLKPVGVRDIPPYAGDVRLSRDGQLVALADGDDSIKLWGREQSAASQSLVGHRGLVHLLAISPGADLVASAAWDKTIKLWAAEDGALLGTLDALLLKPQSLGLSPDGQVLLAAHDGWLRMVHLPSGSWRVLARVGDQGWLSHDNKGRFDCGERGCEALLMRTASGQLLGVEDKLVRPLRGIGKK